MKQVKSHSKEVDEYDEETEDMFSEFGPLQLMLLFKFLFLSPMFALLICLFSR